MSYHFYVHHEKETKVLATQNRDQNGVGRVSDELIGAELIKAKKASFAV
jgi:hypothetical protein